MGTLHVAMHVTTKSGRWRDIGGARRDRTADLLHAMQALSQLSYSPTEAGTLRAVHNPVKALGSWYYACEIIGLASPARSEFGTGLTSDRKRPGCKSSRSICAIPPFTPPQLRAAIPDLLAS